MIKIGIFIFDGVEELDFVGPWEVWTMINTVCQARGEADKIEIELISEQGGQVTCSKGLRVLTDRAMADVSNLDVVCIPGGRGTRPLLENSPVIEWVKNIAPNCDWVTSVCTGSFVLAKAGLTKGKRIATFWNAYDEFSERGLEGELVRELRYVRDGNLLTSAGVSAGIDMALWLTGELFTPDFARAVQKGMQYDPEPPYSADV